MLPPELAKVGDGVNTALSRHVVCFCILSHYTHILTYHFDANSSPEGPYDSLLNNLSITKIHTSINFPDLAQMQPPILLTEGSTLLRHSSVAL